MPILRIGLAQLGLEPLDVQANIERTVAAAEEAAAAGASIVVFPELANSGYVLSNELLRPVAENIQTPGPALTAWSEAAARLEITLVAGFAEVENELLYNSAVVIGPQGAVVGHYRKLHLFAGETEVFAPGNLGLPIVEVANVRIGVLICYDLRFPEVLRILSVRGADIVAVPTAWVGGFDRERKSTTDIGQVRTVRVLANLSAIPVACASQVGNAGPFQFLGSSVMVDAFGQDLAGPADRESDGVLYADLDLDTVSIARNRGKGMNPLQQRRLDVYDSLLGYREDSA